jgi:hypothetical protein
MIDPIALLAKWIDDAGGMETIEAIAYRRCRWATGRE